MLDQFDREVNYLRISVTDRCNLRCTYCMPEEGVKFIPHEDIISFENIIKVVKYGVDRGINKVRLTGGEPLVRRGIVELIKSISKIEGIRDLAMTTNGILLKKYAKQLFDAGLNRVNISLDTMDAMEFKNITRGGNINDVFLGIKAAKEAGLHPIKINCVIKKNKTEKRAIEVSKFCKKENLEIRYIEVMDLKGGSFSIVDGGSGGDCVNCNRLRLNSLGDLRPCLFSDLSYSIKGDNIAKAYKLAIKNKPKNGTSSNSIEFYNIGG